MSPEKPSHETVPVVDVFAGPGGLGEGFSSVGRAAGRRSFRVALSIEKEFYAHRTLELRSFFRQFANTIAPAEYYRVLRGEIGCEELYKQHAPAAAAAREEAWHFELGDPEAPTDAVSHRIEHAIAGRNDWVLVGGPPCQAYSIAGRSRNKGKEDYKPEEDKRHRLYIEYLKIIAEHWPAVFVMENVPGLSKQGSMFPSSDS